jgi:hypothetical protein
MMREQSLDRTIRILRHISGNGTFHHRTMNGEEIADSP